MDGSFNCVDNQKCFTIQNHGANLKMPMDGRYMGPGYLISNINAYRQILSWKRPGFYRMPYIILKQLIYPGNGLYYQGAVFCNMKYKSVKIYSAIIRTMADRLIQMYPSWIWRYMEMVWELPLLMLIVSSLKECYLPGWINHNEDYKKSAKDHIWLPSFYHF